MAGVTSTATGRVVKVELEGLAEAQRDMRKYGASLDDMRDLYQRVGDIGAEGGRRQAPVRTGRAKASTRGEGRPGFAIVKAGGPALPWVPPVHFGWTTRGLGRGRSAEELIGALGSRSRHRRNAKAGAFTDKALRKAARSQNRKSNAVKGKVRGGPIRPNPWIYEGLDLNWSKIIDAADRHLDAKNRAFEAGTL